jgi:hypothetical protein
MSLTWAHTELFKEEDSNFVWNSSERGTASHGTRCGDGEELIVRRDDDPADHRSHRILWGRPGRAVAHGFRSALVLSSLSSPVFPSSAVGASSRRIVTASGSARMARRRAGRAGR